MRRSEKMSAAVSKQNCINVGLKEVNEFENTDTDISALSDFSDLDRDYLPLSESETTEQNDTVSEQDSSSSLEVDEQSIERHIGTHNTPKQQPINESPSPSCNTLLKIEVNKMSVDKKWSKLHYCLYCKKGVQKLPRHFTSVHGKEQSVQKLNNLPVKSQERIALLNQLRNEGNFIHNREVIIAGKGEIVTKRVVCNDTKTVDDFLPCPKCYAMICVKYFNKHKCLKLSYSFERKASKGEAISLLPCIEMSEQFSVDVLGNMKVDDIYYIIIGDKLILEMGRQFYEKIGTGKRSAYNIAQKMRELARVLEKLRALYQAHRNNSESLDLESFLLQPNQVTNVITAVRLAAKYDEQSQKFEIPSIALRVGNYIKRCLSIAIGKSAERSDKHSCELLRNFQAAFDMRWNSEVSAAASRTLDQRKWNKSDELPLARDIQTLIQFLKSKIKELVKIVDKLLNKKSLIDLSKFTLCLIISFNRKRSGEAQRILVNDVLKGMENTTNEDIIEALDEVEKRIASVVRRIVTRGKRGREVAVLLTPLMQSAVMALCSPRNRAIMEINVQNEYVFGVPGTLNSCYRGNQVLKMCAELCGAKRPELLKAPNLRKQLATMTALLNLKKNELDVLASFMGHDLFVHRQNYRLPQGALELAKVTKLLIGKDSRPLDENSDDSDTEDGELSDFDCVTLPPQKVSTQYNGTQTRTTTNQ